MAGSLRNQILLPEQKVIFDYWRQQCLNKGLPSHQDIDPSLIGAFLPTVSLMEVCNKTSDPRYKIRLAGTGLYNFYEKEITGAYLDDLPCGDRVGYWNRIYNAMVDSKRPRIGVTRPGTPTGGHLLQFWLRLPLSCDGENVSMILGFDKFVKRNQLKGDIGESGKTLINSVVCYN